MSNSGQVSILLDAPNPVGGPEDIVVPENSPHTIVEDLHSSACSENQRFAWDLLADRHLGGAMSFASLNLGIEFAEYENMLLVAAPTAGADSGRVMTYINCQSCALFPKPDGGESLLGGRFGASVTVGLFAEAEERVAIGAPLLADDGRVAILYSKNFDRWRIPMDPERHFGVYGSASATSVRRLAIMPVYRGTRPCKAAFPTRNLVRQQSLATSTAMASMS